MRRFKNWILSVFYKKEMLDIRDEYTHQVKKIIYESNKKNLEIETVHRILSEKNHYIVGEANNKNGEHVFIVQWVFGDSIYFMLYSNRYNAINNHPRIMATYYNFYDGKPYIKIDDILVEDNDAGNGSILMPYFIAYCKQFTDAMYISGELSTVDKGHFDRSEHFYEKHGFEVNLNENRSSGNIRYLLREAVV